MIIPLLSLLAALIYVAGALCLKRAADEGAGIWHSAFVSNLSIATLFQSLLFFGGEPFLPSRWWQPLVVGALFFGGQLGALYALQKGDVSLATPLMGIKIVLVALFTTLLIGQKLPLSLWISALICSLSVVALNARGAHPVGAKTLPTLLSAFAAAAFYACADVLIQKWSPAWGLGRFLPLAMGIGGLFSLSLWYFFPVPLRALPTQTKRWLAVGAGLFALATLIFVSAIAHFGQATLANVVYSSRGMWSIVAVALFGGFFGLPEAKLGASMLAWRVASAALMCGAIGLALQSV